jgi:hypothetical protein
LAKQDVRFPVHGFNLGCFWRIRKVFERAVPSLKFSFDEKTPQNPVLAPLGRPWAGFFENRLFSHPCKFFMDSNLQANNSLTVKIDPKMGLFGRKTGGPRLQKNILF